MSTRYQLIKRRAERFTLMVSVKVDEQTAQVAARLRRPNVSYELAPSVGLERVDHSVSLPGNARATRAQGHGSHTLANV